MPGPYNNEEFNIVQIKTDIPSYLRPFFFEKEQIHLVFDKKNSIIVEQRLFSPKTPPSDNDLDLTGDPLKIDLGGDESFGSIVHSVKLHSWPPDEARHYPLPFVVAHRYINNKIKEKESSPMFAVCDGSDPLRTVILGAQHTINFIMSLTINIMDLRDMEMETLRLEEMVNDHRKNVRSKSAEIEFLVNMSYLVYGKFLHNNVNVNYSDNCSNVSMFITSKKCSFRPLQGISHLKMSLQTLIGHKSSSLHDFWEELCLIHQLINAFSCTDKFHDEETLLCSNPLCESEIFNGITILLSTTMIKTKVLKEFTLSNLREETFFDKLWNILKHCENSETLRNSFNFLFEELTELQPNIIVKDDDKSNISAILSDIAHGNLIISSVTFPQALELLIELGIEKMKHDYQAILKHFSASSEQIINSKWNEFYTIDATSMQEGGYRKTRVTQNMKNIGLKLENSTKKLNYIAQLHIAAEFLILIKEQVSLSESTYDHFCESVTEEYTSDTNKVEFSELLEQRLREFSFQLNSSDTKIVEGLYPMSWTMHMKSTVKPYQTVKQGIDIITAYNLSQCQVFPTQIYNNYETLTDQDKKLNYYVSKMVMHKDYCV